MFHAGEEAAAPPKCKTCGGETGVRDTTRPWIRHCSRCEQITPRQVVDALDLIIRWYREDKTGENWRVDVQQMEMDRDGMADLVWPERRPKERE